MSEAVRESPILFSGAIVRAILEGRKTQTRRVVKGIAQPDQINASAIAGMGMFRCPYGKPGDRLWVRETWGLLDPRHKPVNANHHEDVVGKKTCAELAHYAVKGFGCKVAYRADHLTGNDGPDEIKWNPSIFLPRWASRITLEICDVRIERVQDISEEDARAEGIEKTSIGGYRDYDLPSNVMHAVPAVYSYQTLWDCINAKRGYSWESNPWVWVVSFRKLPDALPR